MLAKTLAARLAPLVDAGLIELEATSGESTAQSMLFRPCANLELITIILQSRQTPSGLRRSRWRFGSMVLEPPRATLVSTLRFQQG
jgi:hypothetical protein